MIINKNGHDTVLFDFDGTVMDTNKLIIESWQHTFRTLEGRERPLPEIIETFGEPLADTMEKFFPDIPVDKSINIYRDYHYDKFEDLIELFPGMEKLLIRLKKENYKTGLVTSRLRPTTMEGLNKYDIAKCFDVIVTMEDCTRHKPDPQPAQIALEKLSSLPARSMMLGDTMFDIKCANNAGVTSVLVAWAMAVSEEDIKGPDGPDYILTKAENLFDIL